MSTKSGGSIYLGHLPTNPQCAPPRDRVGAPMKTPRNSAGRSPIIEKLELTTPLQPHHTHGPPHHPGGWLLMRQPPACQAIQENRPRDERTLP